MADAAGLLDHRRLPLQGPIVEPGSAAGFGHSRWHIVVVGGMFLLTRAVAFGGILYAVHGSVRSAVRTAGSFWDAGWYQIIVVTGYAGSIQQVPKAGFYPGYPLLISVVYQPLQRLGLLLDPRYVPLGRSTPLGHDPLLILSMLFVSNACLVVGLVALWRLYEPELGARATTIGCCLLLAVPSSFFLSSGYSESSFLAATALAMLFAERRRWAVAGVAGAAACLIRLPGAALLVVLGLCWLLQARRRETIQPFMWGMALMVLGTAAFPVYTWAVLRDPMLYLHLQAGAGWHHRTSKPLAVWLEMVKRVGWGVLYLLGKGARHANGPFAGIVDGVMTVWATACTALGWLRLPVWQVVWIGLILLYPLASSPANLDAMTSVNRYLLEAWPAFFLSGWWLRRHPWLAGVCLAACVCGLFVLARGQVIGLVA